MSVPFNHDTFSFRVPKSLSKKAACRYTLQSLQSTFICPLCCPGFSNAILDWNPTSDGNGKQLLRASMSRSFLLAFSLGLRSAPFVSQGLLVICLLALHVGCCCCCIVVAICYCSLLRWPMLLVVNVNIIDYAVLAGPLRIPNQGRWLCCGRKGRMWSHHGAIWSKRKSRHQSERSMQPWCSTGRVSAVRWLQWSNETTWSWWLVQMDFQYSMIRSHRHRGCHRTISSLLRVDTQIFWCIIQSSYIHLS